MRFGGSDEPIDAALDLTPEQLTAYSRVNKECLLPALEWTGEEFNLTKEEWRGLTRTFIHQTRDTELSELQKPRPDPEKIPYAAIRDAFREHVGAYLEGRTTQNSS